MSLKCVSRHYSTRLKTWYSLKQTLSFEFSLFLFWGFSKRAHQTNKGLSAEKNRCSYRNYYCNMPQSYLRTLLTLVVFRKENKVKRKKVYRFDDWDEIRRKKSRKKRKTFLFFSHCWGQETVRNGQ